MHSVSGSGRGMGRILLAGAIALTAALATPGCYYLHLASGQASLLWARRATDDVVADDATSARLREQLSLVDRARHFASTLGLEAGGRYTSYVDWPGDRIVTTVVATRPGEVEPRGFDFLLVGRLPYKGFFDRELAEEEARSLEAEGLDVCLVPVTAYSTLGWLDDPLTAPMLRRDDDTRLVETVLHELVHATVFVDSQPDWNEGTARFIGQEASIRFFADDPGQAAHATARVADDRRLAALLLSLRDEVAALYEGTPPSDARSEERARLEESFREQLRGASFETREPEALAERVRLNDACLAITGTYAADQESHSRVLASLGGDLPALVDRMRRAAEEDDPRAWYFGDLTRAPAKVLEAEAAL